MVAVVAATIVGLAALDPQNAEALTVLLIGVVATVAVPQLMTLKSSQKIESSVNGELDERIRLAVRREAAEERAMLIAELREHIRAEIELHGCWVEYNRSSRPPRPRPRAPRRRR